MRKSESFNKRVIYGRGKGRQFQRARCISAEKLEILLTSMPYLFCKKESFGMIVINGQENRQGSSDTRAIS